MAVATVGNAWNDVAPIFDTRKSEGIHASVADNVLIAWPEMLKLVSGRSVLDFGCGEGGLARALANCGHEVLGMKRSAECTPPFTQEYIEQYGKGGSEPLDVPKFLILAFKLC